MDIDKIVQSNQGGAGDDILEFSHVAGPMMLQQGCLRPTRESLNILSKSGVVFFDKEGHESWNIFEPLSQTGNTNLDCA